MHQYLEFLQHILDKGEGRTDRTGTGTIGVFDYTMKFDLLRGFPLVTTKKMHWPSIYWELMWFLDGDTNVKHLQEKGVKIWDAWADEEGELGPIYGKQWRDWDGIDQLLHLKRNLKTNPYSRRHVVSAWNVAQLESMALPPCHMMFQCYVSNNDRLSLKVIQRSADAFLGVPFNIASYALLTHVLADECELKVGELIWTGGDCHIYANHIPQVLEQLQREPLPLHLMLNENDWAPIDYAYHPAIKGDISI